MWSLKFLVLWPILPSSLENAKCHFFFLHCCWYPIRQLSKIDSLIRASLLTSTNFHFNMFTSPLPPAIPQGIMEHWALSIKHKHDGVGNPIRNMVPWVFVCGNVDKKTFVYRWCKEKIVAYRSWDFWKQIQISVFTLVLKFSHIAMGKLNSKLPGREEESKKQNINKTMLKNACVIRKHSRNNFLQ